MEKERSEAFEKLRPACVALTKEHSRDNVQTVMERLMKVKPSILQELQEYVLFPLRFIFKQQLQPQTNLSEDLLCDVCRCLEYVLTHTAVSRWEMFQDLFTSLTTCLSAPDGQGKVVSSEELKLALVKTFESLLKSADRSLIQTLFSPPSLPPLGHAVSVLLRLAETERSRDLQLAAISSLLCLSQAESKTGGKVRLSYGNIFASFLPGIAMALCRVITGDSKQGHAVINRSLETWWKIVCLVLGDSDLQQIQTETGSTHQESLNSKIRGLLVERSAEWVNVTSSKITVLVRQISSVKTNSNWRVRLALVEWAEKLLENCSVSLKECVPVFLEVLVGMIGDEYPNVSSKSRSVLEAYKTRQTDSMVGRQLTEILEENLHVLTTSLPRQIRMADEDEKLIAVNLLSGYISLLGTNIKTLLYSLPHLRRLSLALVQAVELDCRDIRIVEERTTGPGYGVIDTTQHSVRQKKTFKHFRDERIETALIKVCHLLGYYGDVIILTDHFLDVFHESSIYKIPATFILNEILLGVNTGSDLHPDLQTETQFPAAPLPTTDLLNIVRMLIEEYLSQNNFIIQTSSDSGQQQLSPISNLDLVRAESHGSATVASLNRNIIQMALFLEGFGKFALVLGCEFDPLLIEVLYPLLEKLGDDNAYISSAAYAALVDICHACMYRSLDELIKRNADYLMNSISLRLRHLEANPRTPLVLQVMLQYSQADILPLIDDTIQEILCCLDDHYQEEAAMFMKVLYTLTQAINRWFPSSSQKTATSTSEINTQQQKPAVSNKVTSPEEIRDFLLEYHRNKLLAEGDFTDESVADVTPDTTTDTATDVTTDTTTDCIDDDQKKEIPRHVAAVKEVLIRSKHLLSSSSPRLRLLVLNTISQAVLALADWRNELLPLLHELWRPFVSRFADEEKLVTIKALNTLSSMSQVSGDFLRKRIFKDVSPQLKMFLTKQAKISMGSAQAYRYTVNYKLQMACLSNLAYISQMVGAQEIEVDGVVNSYLPYLSCRQPRTLQETAVKGLKQLIILEADVVWLRLCDLYTPDDLSPPGPQFKKVVFLSQPGQKNEFTDNVLKLLPLT